MLRMQAVEMLAALTPEQMAGMPLDTLYQLKLAACQDREEARRWKMRVYASRLEARMSAES